MTVQTGDRAKLPISRFQVLNSVEIVDRDRTTTTLTLGPQYPSTGTTVDYRELGKPCSADYVMAENIGSTALRPSRIERMLVRSAAMVSGVVKLRPELCFIA